MTTTAATRVEQACEKPQDQSGEQGDDVSEFVPKGLIDGGTGGPRPYGGMLGLVSLTRLLFRVCHSWRFGPGA